MTNLYNRNNQSQSGLYYPSYNVDTNMNNYSMGNINSIQIESANQPGLDSNLDVYDHHSNKQLVGDSYYIKDEFDKGYLRNLDQKPRNSKEDSQFINQKTEFLPLSTSQLKDQDDQDNEFKERKVKTDFEEQYTQQLRLSQEQHQIQQQQAQLQQ